MSGIPYPQTHSDFIDWAGRIASEIEKASGGKNRIGKNKLAAIMAAKLPDAPIDFNINTLKAQFNAPLIPVSPFGDSLKTEMAVKELLRRLLSSVLLSIGRQKIFFSHTLEQDVFNASDDALKTKFDEVIREAEERGESNDQLTVKHVKSLMVQFLEELRKVAQHLPATFAYMLEHPEHFYNYSYNALKQWSPGALSELKDIRETGVGIFMYTNSREYTGCEWFTEALPPAKYAYSVVVRVKAIGQPGVVGELENNGWDDFATKIVGGDIRLTADKVVSVVISNLSTREAAKAAISSVDTDEFSAFYDADVWVDKDNEGDVVYQGQLPRFPPDE